MPPLCDLEEIVRASAWWSEAIVDDSKNSASDSAQNKASDDTLNPFSCGPDRCTSEEVNPAVGELCCGANQFGRCTQRKNHDQRQTKGKSNDSGL